MPDMTPTNPDLYRAASFAALAIVRPQWRFGKVERVHVYHGNPDHDCQPWSDGTAQRHAYGYLTEAYHTEMTEDYAVDRKLLKAGLWEMHPCVFRFPGK